MFPSTFRRFFLITISFVGFILSYHSHAKANFNATIYEYAATWGIIPETQGVTFFNTPVHMAKDGSGNLYVADMGNNRIVKLDSSGTVLLKFGTPGSAYEQFNHPRGVSVDPWGSVFVADSYNHRTQKFNFFHVFLHSMGAFPYPAYPNDVLASGNGFFYVTDSGNNRVVKYRDYGTWAAPVTSYGNPRNADGQFAGPFGVTVDSNGNTFVSDSFNHRIQKFNANGELVTKWGKNGGIGGPDGWGTLCGQFFVPRQVALDLNGNVYVTDSVNHRIQKFNNNGVFLGSMGAYGTLPGYFNFPVGVAVDSNGNIFVSDTGNNRIQKFDRYFNFLGMWGTFGIGNGQFNQPMKIAVDGNGNIFVVDRFNNRIQKFDNYGNFLAKWGTNGGAGGLDYIVNSGNGDGEFFLPIGIMVDPLGNVYVSDSSNNRIQKFDNKRNFITKFGTFSTLNGNFFSPQGIGIDSGGNLYIADGILNSVQKFVPSP